MLLLPGRFPDGFDPDHDLLAMLQQQLEPLGTITSAVFPEWYASYVYVGLSRQDGACWVLCYKYRPVVAVSSVEPTDQRCLAVADGTSVQGRVIDAAVRTALAPSFLVLSTEDLARPTSEINAADLSDHERPYLEHARVVAEFLFNNAD